MDRPSASVALLGLALGLEILTRKGMQFVGTSQSKHSIVCVLKAAIRFAVSVV